MITRKVIEAASAKRTANGTIMVTCPICQKEFKIWKSYLKHRKNPPTCSKECRAKNMTGPKSSSWKGGVWDCRRTGYNHLRADILPESDKKLLLNPDVKQVLEHRMIMARHLMRPLKKTEMVHHINGDKKDNRIENLCISDWINHGKEHLKIMREMAVLKQENERLRKLPLAVSLPT